MKHEILQMLSQGAGLIVNNSSVEGLWAYKVLGLRGEQARGRGAHEDHGS